MSGDEMIFDPTMSKKKKKQQPFMLDEEGDAQTEETQPSETKEVEPEPTEDKDVEADEEDKEKEEKKPKKMFMLDEEGDAQTEETQPSETKEVEPEPTEDKDVEADEEDKEKEEKKPKKMFDIDEAEEGVKDLKIESDIQEPAEPEDDLDIMFGNKKKKKKNLLNRVFNIMREKNPDMVAGEKRKFVMKPPQVVRVGTKKTSFVNFTDICKLLHRQPKHLLAFLLAESGTSGSIDGNNQLVIKGRFQQKQIENVLRRYIKEYVTCHTCRSPDTILQKDTRLYFLQCETCHSRCSVASIKTGFQAVTGKRAQLRAKAN
nr:eukaryotic translation initiation factor 2 subunit 2-like [Vulpes vulpes]